MADVGFPRLALTGVGALTSLGFGSLPTGAALRAGLSRPLPLEYGGPAVSGHPVQGYAEGFTHAGAWLRLGLGALRDLSTPGKPPQPAAPPAARLWTASPRPDGARFGDEGEGELGAAFARRLVDQLPPETRPSHAEAVEEGHVGLALALGHAAGALRSGQTEAALIVASDCYVDPMSLEWLAEAHRLKDDDHPTGLAPGEAGVALRLELAERARARGAPLALLEAAWCSPSEGAPAEVWEPPDACAVGRRMARAIREVLPAGRGNALGAEVVLDLNGESWRGAAWGHAQVALARLLDLGRSRVHLPALSLGETGAASGAVGIQLASHLFARGVAQHGIAVVCSVSDDGRVAAMRLSEPGAVLRGSR